MQPQVEEDGRLNDQVLRENFITRVFAYTEWQQLLQQGITPKALLDFHSRYKYLLMATHPQQYKALDRLLSNLHQHDLRYNPDAYLAQQAYLQPHPENLSLRNAL